MAAEKQKTLFLRVPLVAIGAKKSHICPVFYNFLLRNLDSSKIVLNQELYYLNLYYLKTSLIGLEMASCLSLKSFKGKQRFLLLKRLFKIDIQVNAKVYKALYESMV